MTLLKFTVVCLDIDVLDSFNRFDLTIHEALVHVQRNTNVHVDEWSGKYGFVTWHRACVHCVSVDTLNASGALGHSLSLSHSLTHFISLSLALSLSLSLSLSLFFSESLTLARSLTK